MNCFFILLLYFFVRVQCDNVSQNDPNTPNTDSPQRVEVGQKTDILASVRQFPSLLHKCTAVFIAPDALLTTAKCLYCEDCQLFLHAFSSSLTDENRYSKGVSYSIKKTVIHPKYETDPQNNDIGLIQLFKEIGNAVVFPLQSNVPDISGVIVDTFRWQFTSNYREYNLERVAEQIISNAACSSYFNQYVDYKHICTSRNQSILLGQFDQGVPIIDKSRGVETIVGIYEAEGKTRPSKVEIYQAIFPYVAWINKILACNFLCASSSMNNTFLLPTTDQTSVAPGPTPEIPNRNKIPSITPVIIPTGESNEVQQMEPEKKTPKAAMDSDSNRRNGKPLWGVGFPFSEQKSFRAKAHPGKRFS